MPIHIWRRSFKGEAELAEKAETRKANFLTAEEAWKAMLILTYSRFEKQEPLIADCRRSVESYANSDLLRVWKTRAFDRWL